VNRRKFLAAACGCVAGLAGCAGGGPGTDTAGGSATPTEPPEEATTPEAPFEHPGTMETTFAANGGFPADDDPADGRPPAFPDPPASPDADPSTFGTLSVNGERVRLAPIDVVESWYRRGEARFVDARGLEQYRRGHVYGAVLSTATRESTGGPIEGWNADDRVVTYCACPHHLSSLRAAGLQRAGFERVYAIDEGFGVWADRGYPMAGTAFTEGQQVDIREWELSGRVDSRYAGEYVRASVDRQYEAAPIRSDGSYELHLRFAGVTDETPVRVETPAGAVETPLGKLGKRA